ncbi:PIN-like domain-containing protein [Herbaspirillum rubrisubalbicans]|uniref:PIN like domain-containing protein n=1 Tax=Herbaspirillum rubrisubalbicans TaxID=80842 RepID=A0AAD0XIP8_9BURK|nr:PIN-like domain-containing protein [Herbaspirillum rubrisubalbicans]AYR25748.1 hypothetical protein RC54_18885 [Herbaspirillum rubrisubalbicans]
MRDIFAAFYRPSDAELKDAWASALFVLDTNILLNLYRFPLSARNELLELFEKLQSQLWIPFHVGMEFQRGRLGVIAEQQRRFSEVQSALENGLQTMTKKLAELQLANRHSTINVDPILKEIAESIRGFGEKLQQLKESDDVSLDRDSIRDRLDMVFAGRVGNAPTKDSLAKIQRDGDVRFKCEMPPGFKDAQKDKGGSAQFMFQGLLYEAKYGDLILWKQLIEYAKEKAIKKIIFLTDDDKEDWWQSVRESGPKKIGPRPELREELRREAGVDFFHMYNSATFLTHAKENLKVEVQQQSIDDVVDVLRWNNANPIHNQPPLSDLERAGTYVKEWLHSRNIPMLQTGDGVERVSIDSTLVELNIQIFVGIEDFDGIIFELLDAYTKRSRPTPLLIIIVGFGPQCRTAAARWFERYERAVGLPQDISIGYGELILGPLKLGTEVQAQKRFYPLFAVGELGTLFLSDRRFRL